MLYITLGDQPSGVYEGQVIDVCRYLDTQHTSDVRLVAFISARGFQENRQKIKVRYKKAIVLPMVPRLKNWFLNRYTLAMICLATGERVAICRNVLATKIALSLKKQGLLKKVCYDGRGAIASEWEEYDIVRDRNLTSQIHELEKDAVLASDYRIAVSGRLVNYWRNLYGYAGQEHVVIPCTLSTNFDTTLPVAADLYKYRQELGYQEEDIVLVYAGSTAGWQSFALLHDFLSPLLQANHAVKVLFLSKEDENNTVLQKKFKRQVSIRWVKPEEVYKYLLAGDYGILLREQSVTNKVAAPTKFAEYLIAGLPVIISQCLGDYTDFVLNHKCGVVVGEHTLNLYRTTAFDRLRFNILAKEHFLKDSPDNSKAYNKLISSLA